MSASSESKGDLGAVDSFMTEELQNGWRKYEASMDSYDDIWEFVESAAKKAMLSPENLDKLELGFEEILVNIISYAYDEDPRPLFVRTTFQKGTFSLEFADYGKPFDPLDRDMRHSEIPTNDQLPGGYGIFLTKWLFTSISYKYEEFCGKMANHLKMEMDIP